MRSGTARTRLHTVLAAALPLAMSGLADPAAGNGRAPARTHVELVSSDASAIPISLGLGKSVVIDLPDDAKDVLIANPKIADAAIRTPRRAYLIGLTVGQSNIFFFDAAGRQIAGFDIAVTHDVNGIQAALSRALPQAAIHVEPIGKEGIILTGTASSQAEAQQAYEIAARLIGAATGTIAGDGSKVVNAITVRGRDQVMLRVTVAEVQRDVVKQLGIDLNATLSYGTAVVHFNTENPFPVNSGSLGGLFGTAQGAADRLTGLPRIGATIRAMERAGVIRTLAEPNLTAISGESASFLAGGEFPIITGYSCNGATRADCVASVQFKKFGVSLRFTPVVLSEGRISLNVQTEVSELSTEGAVIAQGGVSIPSIKTRRADTTVEIPSGGSLALAGMIQEQTRQQINGVPGMQQVPVLGALFRSRDYLTRQTELVVLVTPYVVRAVAQRQLSRPDDGFADATDPSTLLLARLNRIYGVPGRKLELRGKYRGKFGFILD